MWFKLRSNPSGADKDTMVHLTSSSAQNPWEYASQPSGT